MDQKSGKSVTRTSRNEKKQPFYSLVGNRTPAAAIINEARTSLKTVSTKRPYTPKDVPRTLFGDTNGNQSSRPPSSFSLKSKHFDFPDSRPSSGQNLPGKLSPLEHKPIIPENAIPHVPTTPKKSDKTRRRSTSRSRIYQSPSAENISAVDGQKPSLPSTDSGERRVHSGPKLRTPRDEMKSLDHDRSSSAESKNQRTLKGHLICSGHDSGYGTADSRASSGGPIRMESQTDILSDEDKYWSQEILPILNNLSKDRSTEQLILSIETLYQLLEIKDLLGRKAKNRSQVLKVIYKFLDTESPELQLKIAQLILEFKVSANNLVNVCKLVFKISKEESNDSLFVNGHVMNSLLEMLQQSSPAEDFNYDAGIYALGALKLLSANELLVKYLESLDCVKIADTLITIPLKTTEVRSVQCLVQITGLLRNLSEYERCRAQLCESRCLLHLADIVDSHQAHFDVCLNVARIFSKATTFHDSCLVLSNYDTLFSSSLNLLQKYIQKQDLVVRVCFYLGNLTAKSEESRLKLYSCPNSITVLFEVFNFYFNLRQQGKDDAISLIKLSVDDAGRSIPPAEDVLMKLIRIIANLCISEEVGSALTRNDQCLDYILTVLEGNTIEKNEELVLNSVSALNNLSFYSVTPNANVVKRQFEVAEVLIGILMPDNLMSLDDNLEAMIEVVRVYGNLSRLPEMRAYMSRKKIDLLLITLLDSGRRELIYGCCGVLVNLMMDVDKRSIIKEEDVVRKLINIFQTFGPNDWRLAGLVCQILWNYTCDMHSSNLQFSREELFSIFEELKSSLCESDAMSLAHDLDDVGMKLMKSDYREHFAPVAQQLLERISSLMAQFR